MIRFYLDDIVVLGGTVRSFTEKLAAEKAIKSLANVRAIANEIEVDLSIGYHKTDVEIAKEVTNALQSIHKAVNDEQK